MGSRGNSAVRQLQAADRLAQPLGRIERHAVRAVGHQHGKFLAAIAGGDIGRPEARGHRRTDPAQAVIALLVAVQVVVELEMVDIDQQQRQRRPRPLRPRPFDRERLIERPPVGEAGQAVAAGQRLQR